MWHCVHICGLFTLFGCATWVNYLVKGNFRGKKRVFWKNELYQLNSEFSIPRFYPKLHINPEETFIKCFNRRKLLRKHILRINFNSKSF